MPTPNNNRKKFTREQLFKYFFTSGYTEGQINKCLIQIAEDDKNVDPSAQEFEVGVTDKIEQIIKNVEPDSSLKLSGGASSLPDNLVPQQPQIDNQTIALLAQVAVTRGAGIGGELSALQNEAALRVIQAGDQSLARQLLQMTQETNGKLGSISGETVNQMLKSQGMEVVDLDQFLTEVKAENKKFFSAPPTPQAALPPVDINAFLLEVSK